MKHIDDRSNFLGHASLAGAAFVAIASTVYKYGIYILIPQHLKSLRLSDTEVETMITKHTFLHIGGPHRGGTTFLWSLFKQHPNISGFGHKVGVDESEGIFLQDVYPSFGIGYEFHTAVGGMKNRRLKHQGIGRFGLNSENHLNEDSALIGTEATRLGARHTMFRQWGYFWDVDDETKPVLLEKSPSNMIISRFLQAVWAPSKSVFVFITRHPIANALAHQQFSACAGMTVFELVMHWRVTHQLLVMDTPSLASVHFLRYESLVVDIEGSLAPIYKLLDLDASLVDYADVNVEKHTNKKYEDAYCRSLGPELVKGKPVGTGASDSPNEAAPEDEGGGDRPLVPSPFWAAHGRLVKTFQEAAMVYNYNLSDFASEWPACGDVEYSGVKKLRKQERT
eukprot:CAMPEP_0185771716 /NCGR_PEP_ID=MMETSP1174-20130828/64817_1 /TAXON_ID=35687 /ORGANISM="Dictyocha speculum, Strain CCMP1381" /LENGTH=394 /DNA_ID=CAMNT_0028457655 /DNA_START=1 /DNA_END=1185 /DNA_ORIENTATION=+